MNIPTINNVPVTQVAHIYAEHDFEFVYNQLVEWCSLDVCDYDDEFSLPKYEAVRVPSHDWVAYEDTVMRRYAVRFHARRISKSKEVK